MPSSDSVLRNPPRAAITLYCNITGACSACKPQHMQAEACRQTKHAEKLTCLTDSKAPHQVRPRMHMRLSSQQRDETPSSTTVPLLLWFHICRQVALRVHRRIDTEWQPMHISRSCPAPAGTPAAASAPAPTAAAGDASQAAAAAVDAGITQLGSDSTTAGVEGGGSSAKPHPRQVYFEGSRQTGVGGLNVLYFELGMLLVLSGALPVVYVRKRRYIRL